MHIGGRWARAGEHCSVFSTLWFVFSPVVGSKEGWGLENRYFIFKFRNFRGSFFHCGKILLQKRLLNNKDRKIPKCKNPGYLISRQNRTCEKGCLFGFSKSVPWEGVYFSWLPKSCGSGLLHFFWECGHSLARIKTSQPCDLMIWWFEPVECGLMIWGDTAPVSHAPPPFGTGPAGPYLQRRLLLIPLQLVDAGGRKQSYFLSLLKNDTQKIEVFIFKYLGIPNWPTASLLRRGEIFSRVLLIAHGIYLFPQKGEP